MPVMTVNGVEYVVPGGIRLSEALGQEHAVAQPCAGLGRCGKCRVVARGALSALSPEEERLLTEEDRRADVRLACRTYILGDCTVLYQEQASMEIQLTGGKAAAAVAPAFPDWALRWTWERRRWPPGCMIPRGRYWRRQALPILRAAGVPMSFPGYRLP